MSRLFIYPVRSLRSPENVFRIGNELHQLFMAETTEKANSTRKESGRIRRIFFGPLKGFWAVVGKLTIAVTAIGTLSWFVITLVQFANNPSLATLTGRIGELGGSTERTESLSIDCSDVENQWRAGKNAYIDGNKVRLREGEIAGSIFFKDTVSNFLDFEITFRSFLKSGINTNFSFKNSDGELKYAIGDGDFKTVRHSYSTERRVMKSEKLTLPEEIDNNQDIGFEITIVEKKEGYEAISLLTYYDSTGRPNAEDLKNMVISNPQALYLAVGFGLDARREPKNKDAYVEIVSCVITERAPSKNLNQ